MDTDRQFNGVEGVAGGRTCPKCGQVKQWRNRQWVCLDHDNLVPNDWKHPTSGGLRVEGGLGENETPKIVKEEIKENTVRPKVSEILIKTSKENQILITIPQQAKEIFNKLVWSQLRVSLSVVQAENLLHELEQMPTPQKMSDAKAIIGLVNELEEYIKKEN